MKVPSALGMDAAVTYAFLGRLMNIAGSTGTVLLIVHFLSPIEQGYYYTLLSLVALQIVFEMGFSFVVQQLAAHESAHLKLTAHGVIEGSDVAHARLASALRLSIRWYTASALVMGLILAPLGTAFFARHGAAGGQDVAWHGPWLVAVAASMAGLWCVPFYSFLEGCGQIRAVAAMRLRQSIAANALAWSALLLHHGLYAPALVILAQVAVGLHFLAANRLFLIALLRHRSAEPSIRWGTEVWPFQWRIALSWMCSYFSVQIFIPILFALRGAVEAGKMGMSLSITGYITILALTWTSTKATPFGHLIARGDFRQLDRLFQRTARQSLAAFAAIALSACGVSFLLPKVVPVLSARMVTPWLFLLLVLGAGANCAVQCMATVLRSFKREPFLLQSLAVATLIVALASLTASRWGDAGATFSYFAATCGLALPSALIIFRRAQRLYLAGNVLPICEGGAG